MTERYLQQQIKNKLQQIGCLCYAIEGKAVRGVPDLLVLSAKGDWVLAEVKQPGGRLSAPQRRLRKAVEERGGEVFIWRSIDDAIQTIARTDGHVSETSGT